MGCGAPAHLTHYIRRVLQGFKDFILRGNVVELAVAVVALRRLEELDPDDLGKYTM